MDQTEQSGRSHRGCRSIFTSLFIAVVLVGTAGCTSSFVKSSTKLPAVRSTTTTTTDAKVAGTDTCASNQLLAFVEGITSVGTSLEGTIAFANTGSTSCTLSGFPTYSIVDTYGAPMRNAVVNGGTYSFTNFAASSVTLAKGGEALVNIGADDPNSSGCPAGTVVGIAVPTSTSMQDVSISVAMCAATISTSPIYSPVGPNAASAAPPSAPGSSSQNTGSGSSGVNPQAPSTTTPGETSATGQSTTAPTAPVPTVPVPTP